MGTTARTYGAVFALLALLLVACARREDTVPRRSIDEVLAAHNDSLMALPGVVGTAIGFCDSERCITVYVTDSAAMRGTKLPERLEGYRVKVEVSGQFKAR